MTVLELTRENVLEVIRELQEFFKGLREEVEVYVASQVAGLPTLLIGGHGTGKTTLVKAFYSTLVVKEKDSYRPLKTFMLLLKERHTPMDVFYSYHLPSLMKGVEKIVPKAIGAEAVYLDEIFSNQLVLSALKDFLEERVYDSYHCKWLFFTASTNPPNQYYQNILQLSNMADLDRFDVVVPFESRLGADLFEITSLFAEASERRVAPQLSVKLDVSNIIEVRKEVMSIEVGSKAKSMLALFGHVYSACVFEDEDRQRHFLDKFSVLGEVPCMRCTFRGSLCSKFAIQPCRLIRSTIALAKALAWLRGENRVHYETVIKALHYTPPLRLVIVDESAKNKVATVREAVNVAIREFTKWVDDHRRLLKELRSAVELAKRGKVNDAIRALNDLSYRYNNDPVALSLVHSIALKINRVKEEIEAFIEKTADNKVLKYFIENKTDFKDKAYRRLKKVLDITEAYRWGEEAKRLLNKLLMKGLISEKEFDALSMILTGLQKREHEQYLREDIRIVVRWNEIIIEGPKKIVEDLLK